MNPASTLLWTAGVIVCLLHGPRPALASDKAARSSARQGAIERWQALYREHAEQYQIRRDGSEAALQLAGRSLLNYTNPVRPDEQHGAVFLWTDHGRPAVLGSVWSAVDRRQPSIRNVAHELHALTESGLSAERGDQPAWQVAGPAVEWTSLAKPAPVQTRAARLIQMRRIARDFDAALEAPMQPSSELRLMPHPIYRYPEDAAEVIDGTIFAFVMGTDPELFLLLEARDTAEGTRWFYAPARFTHVPIKLRYRDRAVWTCERAEPFQRTEPYSLHWKLERLPSDMFDDGEGEE